MGRHAAASCVLLVLIVAVAAGLGAQDTAPSPGDRLSTWIAEKIGEHLRIDPGGKPLFGLTDADAASATRQIRRDLGELRARFPLRSLEAEGLVLFRCFETRAEIQLGNIRWRRQIARGPGRASQLTATPRGARLPVGLYDHLIASFTTTSHTAGDVRSLGTRELSRVHREIRSAMKALGHTGSIERFFDFLRTDDRFFYPDSDDGRQAYLTDTRRILAEIEARLDELIVDPPDAPLAVVRVTGGRESETLPMYAPGRGYMVPLADMRSSPKYLLQPIAYHEGVPGHHLQFSVWQVRHPGPQVFSELCLFSVYTEGWGLYAERLPYDLGLYTAPYADAGRLGAEAWRAARVLADIGVNVDGWSDGEAVAFLLANAPIPEAIARIEVQRTRSTPALTTSYLVGKLAIERQRGRAMAALGARFDVRAFHDQVLRYGPMPLVALEGVIDLWIASSLRETTERPRTGAPDLIGPSDTPPR